MFSAVLLQRISLLCGRKLPSVLYRSTGRRGAIFFENKMDFRRSFLKLGRELAWANRIDTKPMRQFFGKEQRMRVIRRSLWHGQLLRRRDQLVCGFFNWLISFSRMPNS